MTIEQFKQRCAQADWHYNYSDDHAVWNRGWLESMELNRIAKEKGKEFIEALREAANNS